MSEQDGRQATALQRPTNDDKEAWKANWKAQSQPWRTEPEIDTERQKYLEERRNIEPNIEQGIYPFKDIKLSRADVEWLLATHENGRGPIDWSNESQRERKGLDLRGADLRHVSLWSLPLARMDGSIGWELYFKYTKEQREAATIHLEGAYLAGAHLEGAILSRVHLNGADLSFAHLERADLEGAQLEEADLRFVHLEEAYLVSARLGGANLYRAFFDTATMLNLIDLSNKQYGAVALADVHWGGVNLAVIDWSAISIIGDERRAKQIKAADSKSNNGDTNTRHERLYMHEQAVRAYRQLAVVLREQGLNEDASRFVYQAQVLQRTVFRLRGGLKYFGQFLFSLFLDLLAGYGYKPWRSFLAYLIVIATFATAYFIIGHTVGPVLSPLGSFVFSMTSFHGRGFFPGGIGLEDPLTVLAALEAFVGLLIEVTFIATLTQRLFGR